MYYILISELLVTPFLRFADPPGNFQRHVLAPRALTQQEMNLNFIGTPYRLGERFTVHNSMIDCCCCRQQEKLAHSFFISLNYFQAMTNILFVCFFYSSMLPAVFFFGFAILMVQYYTDRYCLLRIWRRAPAIGPNLARISRRYFFSIALVVFICSSAFAWAQFPYDNVCDKIGSTERVLQMEYINVRLLDGSLVNVTVAQETPVYHCR